jgi:P63C domain-containing protein
MAASEFGSREAGRKGGEARAKALSKVERKAIASHAAQARWGNSIPEATHEGDLVIGDATISSAVLADETRLLAQAQVVRAIGRKGKIKGGRKYDEDRNVPVFLTANNLKPYIPSELLENSKPIVYRAVSGGKSIGYRAELLPQICYVFVDADEADALRPNQKHIAEQCKILIRGFATIGIIALIDEATGYQADRARDALARILESFISDELRRWVKTFPDDYFKELCRLKNVEFRPDMKLPRYFGRMTNNIVYQRLAPGVLRELKTITPTTTAGNRAHKFHQRLSLEIGHPKLLEHLGMAIAAMKLSLTYSEFKEKLNRIAPVYRDAPLFDNQD